MYKIILLLSILFSSFNPTILAQENDFKFVKLSLEKGIAHDLTYCIIKDSKGFIWIGTMHGLVKYDGVNYTLYRHNPLDPSSISFDDIISLYEDSDKNIWIGTWGGGLNKLNPATEKFTRFVNDPADSTSINDNVVWSIAEDADKNIWCGTEHAGLQMLDVKRNHFIGYLNGRPVKSIHSDRNGILWVGGGNSIYKFLKKENIFEKIPIKVKDLPSFIFINRIFEDSKGNLFLGLNSGLIKFNPVKNTFIRIEDKSNPIRIVQSIAEDDNGNIWLGTVHGLKKLDAQNNIKSFYHDPADENSLSGNSIISLVYDNSGVLWIAAYERGINKLVLRENKFKHFPALTSGKTFTNPAHIKSFVEDKNNNIWIATLNNGLLKFNPNRKTVHSFTPPGINFFLINSLVIDDNVLLLATNQGLLNFNTTSNKFITPDYPFKNAGSRIINFTSVFTDSKYIWAGTAGMGLIKILKEDNTVAYFSSENGKLKSSNSNYILSIYKDCEGVYWFGTYGGLLKFNEAQNSFTSFVHDGKDKFSLSNNYVFDIFEDSHKNFWIGTSNGLNKMNKSTNRFTHLFEQDGLPNSVICAIVEDDKNNLWITTYKGLSRFIPERNEFINYYSSDGLQGNIFSYNAALKSSNGSIYIGGKRGFNVFNPAELKRDKFSPPVHITSVSTNLKGQRHKIDFSGNIILPYFSNSLVFEFTSLDFKNPEKIIYQYMLEGFDNSWVNSGNINHAVYTNLSPGTYNLKVRATNSDGNWSENTAAVSFRISPPFWRTWWFILTVFVLLALTLYLIHRLRLKSKIQKAVVLETIRAQEEEKIRRRTAVDFHDELGHRLTRISLLTEILKRKVKDSYSEILPLLDKISENSQQLYDGTRDFIWSIDPHKDSFAELVIRLKDFGDDIFSGTDIQFDVTGIPGESPDVPLSMDWRRHITLIFKEGMNNSLKHSHSKRVVLESSIKDNDLFITLSDDGLGFTETMESTGNGLKNMRKRAEKLSGNLEIDSQPGKGTRITFRGIIQKKSIHFN